MDQLRIPHPSVPRNRLICEPLFLAHYIERAGTGTLDMIRLCAEAGLPEPEFRNEGERFITIIWRDWLTDEVLAKLDLKKRQLRAVVYLKTHKQITNSSYQEMLGVSRATATRDLDMLRTIGIVERSGTTGKGTHYTITRKRIIKESIDS